LVADVRKVQRVLIESGPEKLIVPHHFQRQIAFFDLPFTSPKPDRSTLLAVLMT
jgi:hypothetical protein